MKILFIVPYPLERAPSQRFRFEQYFKVLRQRGNSVTIQPLLSASGYEVLRSGTFLQKFVLLLGAIAKRTEALVAAFRHDKVFIHREAAPVGPPVIEWVIAVVIGKKIIYDFDDAIWLTDKRSEGPLQRAIRWRSKVASICRWSYKVSCGNRFLTNYASQFNSRAVLNPTTVDTVNRHNPALFSTARENNMITIVWTGSSTTLKYLALIETVLQSLEDEFSLLRLMVIADQRPALNLKRLDFVGWSSKTEVEALSLADIGVMPLTDDDWSRGKCGFKALQYMAMEIPVVASAVGANLDIITHGQNGFLAATDKDWMETLRRLITDKQLRRNIGASGRMRVEQNYSVASNEDNFLSLFE